MSSTLLIILGVAGLVGSAVSRLWPVLRRCTPRSSRGGRLHEVVDAYSLLHYSLIENGETEEAEHLRTITLPSALKPPGDI